MRTLEELFYEDGVTEVWLRTYGYTEISCFSKVWQPFKHARIVRFTIERNPWGHLLVYNKNFWVDDDCSVQLDDTFEYKGDLKWVSTADYDLECRASND